MQSQFTSPDARPLLTIYRQKDRNTELVALTCDGKAVAQLSRRQYVVLELTPGPHSCGIETQTPVQVMAKPGEEYYIRVGPRLLSAGWTMKLVPNGEGEDGMATAEMISK